MIAQKTYMAKANEVKRDCYLIDAQDKVLGRIATKAATILRGKHKATYTPHVDTGDLVVIINAEKVKVTGKKMQDKIYRKYTGYHGGQKNIKLSDLLELAPTQVLKQAIGRMIPSGALGSKMKLKLKIYAGSEHPHTAQKPKVLEV